MKFESMKEAFLSQAKDNFLFDCRVAGLELEIVRLYRNVLGAFVRFTGDITVKELTPEHVRVYIDNLSDGPSEGQQHTISVINHYAIIHTWIRWLYAQKFVTERASSYVKPPRLIDRFPSDLPTGV